MKKVVLILSCLILIASVGVMGVGCDDDDTVEWRLATYSLPGTFQTEMLQYFADLVEEKTDGQMTIKVDTSLYTFSEIFDAVSSGVVEMGFSAASFYPNQMPTVMGVTAYAGPVATSVGESVELLKALNEGVPGWVQEDEDKNVRTLMWISTGSADFYSKSLVTKIEDINGMKVGGAPGVSDIITQLGGSPVPMEMMEIYQNAQQGVIDAFLFASTEELYLQGQLYSVLPNITVMHIIGMASALIYQPAFEDLPEDLQNAVMDAASETEAKATADYEASWSTTLQTLEDNPDIDAYVLSPTERAEWMDAAILPILHGVMQYFLSPADAAKADEIIAPYLD